MINKEQFVDLVTKQRNWNKRLDEIEKILHCFIFDCDWVAYGGEVFDKALEISFKEPAIDTINWWIYERSENQSLIMKDADDKEIPTETLDDIWEIVKDDRI